MNTSLIILDLNGTLVKTDFKGQDYGVGKEDFTIGNKNVFVRPFLDTFLDSLFASYDVAVWTCNSEYYAKELCRKVFRKHYDRIKFVFCKTECDLLPGKTNYRGQSMTKNLERVWNSFPQYNKSNTILVDDEAEKSFFHPENLVLVPTFVPCTQELDVQLLYALEKIKQHPISSIIPPLFQNEQ